MKPKKLNLDEIWNLYLLLKHAVEGREPKETLLDEVLEIIHLAEPQALLASIRIMYDNKIRINSPAEFNEAFIKGVLKCEFLQFCDVIRGLDGSSK